MIAQALRAVLSVRSAHPREQRMLRSLIACLFFLLPAGGAGAQYSLDPAFSDGWFDPERETLEYCVPAEYYAAETSCNFVCGVKGPARTKVCILRDDDIRRFCVADFRGTKPERDRLRECTGGNGKGNKSSTEQSSLSEEAREYFHKDESSGMSTHDQVMGDCERDRATECREEADETFGNPKAASARKAWLAECKAEAKTLRAYCKAARSGASQASLWEIHQKRKRHYATLEDIRIKAEEATQSEY